jgi:hypothetical protein
MAALSSALYNNDLVFYSDALWTTRQTAIQSTGASTLTLLGVGAASVTMTNLSTPVSSSDAVNKSYVDNAISGLTWKSPVIVTTTANITLSGPQTIDGIAVVAGNRVLVNQQTPNAPGNVANGIYVVAAGAWSRATDMATGADASGYAVYCESGTTNGGKAFVETLEPAIVDTDLIQFTVFSSITPVTPGGSNTQMQYNNSGSFGGATMTYNNGTNNFNITSGNFTVNAGNLSTTAGTITSGSATDATSTSTGSIQTAGGIGITKQLWVGTNLTMPGTGAILSLTDIGSSISVSGTTDATNINTGSIKTAGGVGIAKQLWVGANLTMSGTSAVLSLTDTGSSITVSGTTDATNTSTGSIKTAGGVGITKQLWVGTNLTMPGTSAILSLTDTGSSITVSGTTNATSSTTGSIKTAGGIGVVQDVFCGGNVYATAFKSTSDMTLKTNIKPLNNTLDIVNNIEGVQFNWVNKKMGTELQTGLLAQQLEEIGLSHIVDSNHGYKTVNYLSLFPYLIGAIQELTQEVEELRNSMKMPPPSSFVPFKGF